MQREVNKGRPHWVRREAASFVGLATTAVLYTVGAHWLDGLASYTLMIGAFAWLFVVLLWCAASVVRHAEGLAHLLGEPYGTLILTLAVVAMEVALIAAITVGGHSDITLARDMMFAVLMIVLNGLIGFTLVLGALRHGQQEYNIDGAAAYLAVLAPLSVLTLVLPVFTLSTALASFSLPQAIFFSVTTLLLYGVFLAVQTMRHRAFFVEPRQLNLGVEEADDEVHEEAPGSIGEHAFWLVMALAPVVLLAEKLAVLVDNGLALTGLPTALGGVLIALLVLSAEAASAVRAALHDKLQRSVNICLGSALSTIGLTVPAVLIISIFTGQAVQLGLNQVNMVLLFLTLFVSLLTFGTGRTNVLLGTVHLILFAAFLALMFEP
jgi:Ca2+:H+ antiporter